MCAVGIFSTAGVVTAAARQPASAEQGVVVESKSAQGAVVGWKSAQGSVAEPKSATDPVVTVYKSPTCECCRKWVEHLRTDGFRVVAHDVKDLAPVKTRHGITPELESCHTALVDGYVIEGHVPVDVIRRALKERPRVTGLAVAGMPAGSPGMEMAGGYSERYNVVSFDKSGKTKVYAKR